MLQADHLVSGFLDGTYGMFYLHTLQRNPEITNNIDKIEKTQISKVLGRDWTLKYAIRVGYMYYVHKQMTDFISNLINVNNISTGEVYQIIRCNT